MKSLLKHLIIPFQAIDQALPKSGMILDLGCGDGVVTRYLAHKNPTRELIGIDQDKARVRLAKDRSKDLPQVRYLVGDIRRLKLKKKASGGILLDVLHHVPARDQWPLLKTIAGKIGKGGVLVIKEIDRSDMVRSKISRVWEWLFYPHDTITYLRSNTLVGMLKKLGFRVTHQKRLLFVPASIHLFIATKQ